MDHPVLIIVMRFVHIVSAIVAVGGLTFMAFCLRPAARQLDETAHEKLQSVVKSRWARVQWIAIALLVLSGVYNWVLSAAAYKTAGPIANALIGTKVLLAMILFAVAWAHGAKLIKSDKVASMINVHLALIVILLAAALRFYRMAQGA